MSKSEIQSVNKGSEILELAHFSDHRSFAPKLPVRKTIIRRKKRAASFERRFLSARGSGDCKLEIAVIWRDTVMSVKQYRADNQTSITVGPDKGCDYIIDTGAAGKIIVAHCNNNQWQILFNNADDGFILKGDKKIEFKSGDSSEFAVPDIQATVKPGSLACNVDGNVRAKFQFGEVTLLIRYTNVASFVAPLLAGIRLSSYGPLAASLLVHFALFSVILFATSRVDALMVDRIMNTSRFVVEVEQPIEEPTVDVQDEIPPDDEIPQDPVAVNDHDVIAPNTTSTSTGAGQVMSKSAAAKMAAGSGILNQASAMNSLLAAGPTVDDLNNVELFHFDPTAAAASRNYGLTMTGTQGGLPGVSSIPGGPSNMASKTGSRLVTTGHTVDIQIPQKKETIVKPAGKIDINGTLDKITVQKVVRSHIGELRACYEREAIKIKGLAGRVVVVWFIANNGSVTKALVKESSMHNENVEKCVISSISHWRFPAIKGGGMAQIEYPFDFIMNK